MKKLSPVTNRTVRQALFTAFLASGWVTIHPLAAWSACAKGQQEVQETCYNSGTANSTGCQDLTSLGGPSGCWVYANVDPDSASAQTNSNSGGIVTNNSNNNNSNRNYNGNNNNAPQNVNCTVSTDINAQYGCTSTASLNTAAQVTNLAGQTLGSMATQFQGAQASATAEQSATMSASYEAAASTAKFSAYTEMGLGAVNIGMSVAQFMDASQHQDDADAMTAAANQAGSTNSYTLAKNAAAMAPGAPTSRQNMGTVTLNNQNEILQDIYTGGVTRQGVQGGDYYSANTTNTIAHEKNDIQGTANAAAGEQQADATAGKLAAFTTVIQGVSEAGQGALQLVAAEQYEKAAEALAQNQNPDATAFAPTIGNINPGSDSFSSGSTALNPGTAATDASNANTPTTPGGNTNLGNPFNVASPDNGGGGGPNPTPFTPGAPTAPNSGSGAPPLAASGTAAAKPEDDNSQPKAADNGRQQFGYGGGNGVGYVAGGVAAEKGENLSGLLSQLLPTKKDEDQAKTNGIMDFASRNPASMPDSLLGRNVNLFKRIEQATQAHWRQGTVGI